MKKIIEFFRNFSVGVSEKRLAYNISKPSGIPAQPERPVVQMAKDSKTFLKYLATHQAIKKLFAKPTDISKKRQRITLKDKDGMMAMTARGELKTRLETKSERNKRVTTEKFKARLGLIEVFVGKILSKEGFVQNNLVEDLYEHKTKGNVDAAKYAKQLLIYTQANFQSIARKANSERKTTLATKTRNVKEQATTKIEAAKPGSDEWIKGFPTKTASTKTANFYSKELTALAIRLAEASRHGNISEAKDLPEGDKLRAKLNATLNPLGVHIGIVYGYRPDQITFNGPMAWKSISYYSSKRGRRIPGTKRRNRVRAALKKIA